LKSGILRTINRPGTWPAFFCAANATKTISAISAEEIQRPVVSSKTEDSVGVLDRGPRVVRDRLDGGLDPFVHPHRH